MVKFSDLLRPVGKLRKAKSADVLSGEQKTRRVSLGRYGEQKEVVVGGKAIKEIEITGQKQEDVIEEHRRHKKLTKRKSFEGNDVKVSCRDLAPADHEGWLYKKSGGTGITPVSWKQVWVVLKNGVLYLFKTSFDIIALHVYQVRNFSVAPLPEEKRKFTFKLVPKNVPPEALQEAKGVVFAAYSDEDVEHWCDVLNKAALGFIIQPAKSASPTTDDRRRCYSAAVKPNKNKHLNGALETDGVTAHRSRTQSASIKRQSTFTGKEEETTGLPNTSYPVQTALPSTFVRTSSQSRQRKTSATATPSSVLAVGTMFDEIDDPNNDTTDEHTATEDITSLLYKEKEVIEIDGDGPPQYIIKDYEKTDQEEEDEERLRKLEVKKEIERINKQAKVVAVESNAETARLDVEEIKDSHQTDDNDNELADSQDIHIQPPEEFRQDMPQVDVNISAQKEVVENTDAEKVKEREVPVPAVTDNDTEKDEMVSESEKDDQQLNSNKEDDSADDSQLQDTSLKDSSGETNTIEEAAETVTILCKIKDDNRIGEPEVNLPSDDKNLPSDEQMQEESEQDVEVTVDIQPDKQYEEAAPITVDPLSKDLVNSIKESLANDDLDYTSDDEQVQVDNNEHQSTDNTPETPETPVKQQEISEIPSETPGESEVPTDLSAMSDELPQSPKPSIEITLESDVAADTTDISNGSHEASSTTPEDSEVQKGIDEASQDNAISTDTSEVNETPLAENETDPDTSTLVDQFDSMMDNLKAETENDMNTAVEPEAPNPESETNVDGVSEEKDNLSTDVVTNLQKEDDTEQEKIKVEAEDDVKPEEAESAPVSEDIDKQQSGGSETENCTDEHKSNTENQLVDSVPNEHPPDENLITIEVVNSAPIHEASDENENRREEEHEDSESNQEKQVNVTASVNVTLEHISGTSGAISSDQPDLETFALESCI